MAEKFLNLSGLQYLLSKIKSALPTAGAGIDITTNVVSRKHTTITAASATPSIAITGNQIVKCTNNAITALTISSVTDSDLESVIYFKTSSSTTLSVPNNVTVYGDTTLAANTEYAIAIRNLNVVIAPAGGITISWASLYGKPTFGTAASANKGVANGVAELDSNGKVPSSQLPAYVDDVLEYDTRSAFPATGTSGIIYIDKATNNTYRWGGSDYVAVGSSLALGETSGTAYRGDRGKIAYDHASDSGRLTSAKTSGLYKVAVTAEGHIASATAVSQSDITGMGIASDSEATTNSKGLMSAADKAKLDSLGASSGAVVEAYPRSGQTELSSTWLATGSASGTVITPDAANLYVLMSNSTNYSVGDHFRWGGSAYVKVAAVPALANKADKTNVAAGTVGGDVNDGCFKVPIVTVTSDGTVSAKSEAEIPAVTFKNSSQTLTGANTIAFENTRNYIIAATTASALNLTFTSNVNGEHYVLIKNNGSSECTVTFNSVSYNNTAISSANTYVPNDAVTIAAGKAIEISVYVMYNTTIGHHAIITVSEPLTA